MSEYGKDAARPASRQPLPVTDGLDPASILRAMYVPARDSRVDPGDDGADTATRAIPPPGVAMTSCALHRSPSGA